MASGRLWAELITCSHQEQSINAICDYLPISLRLNTSTLVEDNETYTHLRDSGSKKESNQRLNKTHRLHDENTKIRQENSVRRE